MNKLLRLLIFSTACFMSMLANSPLTRAKNVSFEDTKAGPTASFTADPVCQGDPTSFQNNSTTLSGTIVASIWDFGDGEGSTTFQPNHIYTDAGTYTVKLTVINTDGDVGTHSGTAEVYPSGNANFTFSSDTQCTGSNFQFTNLSSVFSGSIDSYAWDFGDGMTSDEVNPAHSYDQVDTYTVTLTTTTDNGCTNSTSQTITVYPEVVAEFTAGAGCLGETTQFINNSQANGAKVSYLWDLGDGTTSTELNPQHIYSEAGEYTATLQATAEGGCVTVDSEVISIHHIPVANFSADPVCDGENVTFQNLSTIESGEIVDYLWDFGDQTNSIVKNPVKQYLNPGTYPVKLTVVSDNGCKSDTTLEVVVHSSPIADFTVENICFGTAVKPENRSTADLNYQWDFGDSNTSVLPYPSQNYKSPGVYEVHLVVSDDNSCRDSVSHPVVVYNLPVIDAGEDISVSQGYSVQLTAKGALNYYWSPAETLNNSSIANPLATPLDTTEYIVVGKDQFGCENSDTVRVSVNEDFKLVATNVLTPDENGKNDTWVIKNIETFGDAHVRVYDRWGKNVYESTAYHNDWRGTSGNDILPDGTYYYFISFARSDKEYKGAITIIRNKQ